MKALISFEPQLHANLLALVAYFVGYLPPTRTVFCFVVNSFSWVISIKHHSNKGF